MANELAERGGIGVRYSCHCSHILIKQLVGIGPVLKRFQRVIATLFPKIRFPGLARVSFGIGNSEEDVDTLIYIMDKIARQQRPLPHKDIQKQMNDFIMAIAQKVYS